MPPTVLKPYPGVVHIVHQNQVQGAKSFMRLQEFYESPLSNENGPIKRRHFSRNEFKEAYAKSTGTGTGYGEFSYYTDWNGFNIPGNVVDEWLELFEPDFMETYLADAIRQNRRADGSYYVIGTHEQIDSATIDHELSHAFWHLDSAYKCSALELVTHLPVRFYILMDKKLKEMGYCDEVIEDEITAYLSTDNLYDIVDMLETRAIPWDDMLEFQQHFRAYVDDLDD